MIPLQYLTDLPDLIRLGVITVSLQVQPFGHSFFPEYMMTASRPLRKP